jgi:hypothetical protein
MKKKPNDGPQVFVVKLLKLKTGELIVSKIRKSENVITLKDPMQLLSIPIFDEKGFVNGNDICFREWIEGAAVQRFNIDASIVLIETECARDIRSLYDKTVAQDKDTYKEGYTQDIIDLLNQDAIQSDPDNKPKPKSKDNKQKGPGPTGTGPPQERMDNDEDDLDGNGWGDVPPRFKM